MNMPVNNVFMENSFSKDKINNFNFTRDVDETDQRSKNSTLSFKHLNIETFQDNNNTNILSNGGMRGLIEFGSQALISPVYR